MTDKGASAHPLDAIEILRRDHAELQQLFADYFATRETRRYDLVPGLCEAVRHHMLLDAQIFFPQLARALGDERLTFGAAAEHVAVDDFVEELLHPDPGDFGLSERVHRLATMVSHHVRTAESPEGPFATALASTMDRAAVGYMLQQRKREWMFDSQRRHPHSN